MVTPGGGYKRALREPWISDQTWKFIAERNTLHQQRYNSTAGNNVLSWNALLKTDQRDWLETEAEEAAAASMKRQRPNLLKNISQLWGNNAYHHHLKNLKKPFMSGLNLCLGDPTSFLESFISPYTKAPQEQPKSSATKEIGDVCTQARKKREPENEFAGDIQKIGCWRQSAE